MINLKTGQERVEPAHIQFSMKMAKNHVSCMRAIQQAMALKF